MNILVVDDEPAYRMLLKDFLRDEGWIVYTASEGEEGLKKLEEQQMDFIISDIYMPVMNGIKFQESLRSLPEYKETPFLFVSGHDDEHTLQAIGISKKCGFMTKINSFNVLKSWIDYLMTPFERRSSLPPRIEPKLNVYSRPGRN